MITAKNIKEYCDNYPRYVNNNILEIASECDGCKYEYVCSNFMDILDNDIEPKDWTRKDIYYMDDFLTEFNKIL